MPEFGGLPVATSLFMAQAAARTTPYPCACILDMLMLLMSRDVDMMLRATLKQR
jgi:hypothetical protein